ncbi:multiple epidermal growth factor-like domains protein 6 [Panthera leo]|uniref:multiple epidermal growth factor-like domains protein 6 n=1 Tax=Panthera leo TaxID=9689 RepID=UPI001C69ECAE|nr:multiple epidermal growth factor-like domains protein 6 [Panthera leo]
MKETSIIQSSLVTFRDILPNEKIFQEEGPKANTKHSESGQAGCPEGTYDLNCQRMHKYLNGGSCDTVIGTYHCPPGFIGADCSQTCPEDHHGRDCVQPCSCGSGQCDPVTGRCQCPPGKMRARCQQGYPKQCMAQTVN